MALLPNAKVAVRLALANYLRTNLSASWPSLLVTENWPTPQRAFPPQSLTVLAPSDGQVTEYHQPVVWSVTPTTGVNCTVLYSYGKLKIPLQLDAWAQYESLRDDLAASVTPLVNVPADVTLGVAGNQPELAQAPGLVIPIPTYFSVTAEFRFEPAPGPREGSDPALMGEWRATWDGEALIYLMAQDTKPLMKTIVMQMAVNGGSNELYQLAQTPSSMALTPANPTLTSGSPTQQMTATSTLADSSTVDVSAWSVWVSSNPAVATVNSTGLVTRVSVGTATITATYMTVSGSTTVTCS